MTITRREFNMASLGLLGAMTGAGALAALPQVNRRWVLAARPTGKPTVDNFKLEEAPLDEPGEGQVLLQTLYLSLDPYMRGRMNAGASYANPVDLGQVMSGGIELLSVRRVESAAPWQGVSQERVASAILDSLG